MRNLFFFFYFCSFVIFGFFPGERNELEYTKRLPRFHERRRGDKFGARKKKNSSGPQVTNDPNQQKRRNKWDVFVCIFFYLFSKKQISQTKYLKKH
mmetsp:Transcript_18563/g.35526  ORF Transcript_18563/g.35526 Transcript_18563/m.35526 type:complete len:96 (-) Transcript_18563:155-442(-)